MMKKLKKISTIVCIILIVFLAGVTISLVIQKSKGEEIDLLGYKVYYVLTDSMTPSLEVGDVILSKDSEGVEVGDVVTYVAISGIIEGELVTHKVIEVYEENGTTMVVTQGTKTGATPDEPIEASAILGTMVCEMHVIGWLFGIIQEPIGFVLVIALPIILTIIYCIYDYMKQRQKQQEKAIAKTPIDKEELKRQAVEEYKNSLQQNSEQNNPNNSTNKEGDK